jgi:hypothetical protein
MGFEKNWHYDFPPISRLVSLMYACVECEPIGEARIGREKMCFVVGVKRVEIPGGPVVQAHRPTEVICHLAIQKPRFES